MATASSTEIKDFLKGGVVNSANTRDTTGAVALTLDEGVALEIQEVRLHLGAAGGAGSFTVTLDHGTNVALDILLLTEDMTTATDVHWIPRPFTLSSADKLVLAYANANNKTYGAEIIWRKI